MSEFIDDVLKALTDYAPMAAWFALFLSVMHVGISGWNTGIASRNRRDTLAEREPVAELSSVPWEPLMRRLIVTVRNPQRVGIKVAEVELLNPGAVTFLHEDNEVERVGFGEPVEPGESGKFLVLAVATSEGPQEVSIRVHYYDRTDQTGVPKQIPARCEINFDQSVRKKRRVVSKGVRVRRSNWMMR
ncbi:hypothetical protein NUH88_11770 [Nisaea acidiphila]|uniref:Uncharacterized protein n=1 Tax=Nisaea acidiphila TaxID=1862145 RepID=A0A9J7ALR1_9PROT|nr:hypothetical protein [Nisaea acidiphila]UUX48094.1 hypothetical protein NUH88_11770 [Nisaea acidiphila]